MNMQRRGFLKTLAATGAAGAIAGCATTGSGPSMGKVVVVGGGYGGATAAKYIRMWSDGRIDVTLVEPNAAFVSCPTSNLVLGGSKTIADITVPYDGLARNHGVRVVRDTVTAVDPDKRVVRLGGGGELPYDRVILSPGIDFMFENVPGYASAEAQQNVFHAWKAGPQTVAQAAAGVTEKAQQRQPAPGPLFGSPLDPRYTFDTFVEGSSNRVALAAAKTIAEAGASAVRFNPLFIHSSVGLGKTHLLQAIANAALASNTTGRGNVAASGAWRSRSSWASAASPMSDGCCRRGASPPD